MYLILDSEKTSSAFSPFIRSLTGTQIGRCRASFQLKYYHSNLFGGFLFVETQFFLAEVGHNLATRCQVSLPA